MTPRLKIRDIVITERPVPFTHPFRFGVVTVDGANETFVHVEIEVEGLGRSRGASAELLVPKWFDKNPALSPAQTVDELRASLRLARELYLGRDFDSAFGLHAASYPALMAACARAGLPPLAAAYGAAEIDKAVLDALLRALRLDVFTGLTRNVMGLDARLTPDIGENDIATFLTSRRPLDRVFVRHTIGLTDKIDELAPEIARHGLRYFKIKLAGDPAADRARLERIVAALDALSIDYRVTLDANEQYPDARALRTLVDALREDAALRSGRERLLYIEQPLPRETSFAAPLGEAGKAFAFIIDEADSDYDAFPKALALGYRGISTKSCKGIYKSLLNGARALRSGAFIAAEDLTCQAGLGVQQDTALAAFHGISHCERNGHHYVDGFAAAPAAEAQAFLAAHPDLYEQNDGQVRLRIRDGALVIASLGGAPGFASAVDPAQIGGAFSQHHSVREYAS